MKKIKKPTWNEVWLSMAQIISRRSHHPESKVGAIVVTEDNTQVLSVGYNGNAAGLSNEPESLEPGCSGLLHAEINALLKLDYNNPKGKKMYITLSPCDYCARAIVNSKIDTVFYADEYRDAKGIDILRMAGINVQRLNKAAESLY